MHKHRAAVSPGLKDGRTSRDHTGAYYSFQYSNTICVIQMHVWTHRNINEHAYTNIHVHTYARKHNMELVRDLVIQRTSFATDQSLFDSFFFNSCIATRRCWQLNHSYSFCLFEFNKYRSLFDAVFTRQRNLNSCLGASFLKSWCILVSQERAEIEIFGHRKSTKWQCYNVNY